MTFDASGTPWDIRLGYVEGVGFSKSKQQEIGKSVFLLLDFQIEDDVLAAIEV